jgi:hypothetical protein
MEIREIVPGTTLKEADVLDLLVRYGQTDGAHHKAWVIDQAVRLLSGEHYAALIAAAKDGEDGPETYGWEEGIPP